MSQYAEKVTDPTFAAFLESAPPGTSWVRLSTAPIEKETGRGQTYWALPTSDIRLHCGSASCGGVRTFEEVSYRHDKWFSIEAKVKTTMLEYNCRNCRSDVKLYAIAHRLHNGVAEMGKLGELPAFGPSVPSRVLGMAGPDSELFKKGRASENQGFGVGAFAYYRCVIENQWGRLLDEIIRVAKTTGSPEATVQLLERARRETQFKKAADMVKDAVPEALKIRGHNPITLLHRSLSANLHAGDDKECLELAGAIRTVLYELAERVALALKNERELGDALKRLMAPRPSSNDAS